MDQSTGLPTFRIEAGTALAQASPWHSTPVTMDSPALDVMTDLTKVKAATTQPTQSLRAAEQTMIFQGVRMLFVVTDMPSIEGLVTANDLLGDKPMRVVHERSGRYEDLCVADVMTPLSALFAVDLARLKDARVGDAIATLKRFGRSHLLVVERASADTPRRIRGVISKSQIERQLGAVFDIAPIAHSFSEIERALA